MPFQLVMISTAPVTYIPVYLTSQIYPVDVIEQMTESVLPQFLPFYQESDSMGTGLIFASGSLVSSLHTYTDGLPEAMQDQISFDSGSLTSSLHTYTNGLPEAMQDQISFGSGSLVIALQTYNNYPPEAMQDTISFNSGTLI